MQSVLSGIWTRVAVSISYDDNHYTTGKLMTMHKAFHPRDGVDRLHVSRKGGRELTSIEDSVDASIQRIEDFTEKRGEWLITATRNNTDNTRTNWTTITRNQKWEESNYQRYLMVYPWSLSDKMSPQFSKTLLHLYSYFQVFQSLYQPFGDCIKSTNYNWYHRHFHVL